jgi:hypothetical protein
VRSIPLPTVLHACKRVEERVSARATLRAYDTALLAGNGNAGCSLLTAAAQKELARVNHVSSCEKVIEVAGHLLKSSPKLAAQVRSYASTVKVTLHGGTARCPSWVVAA